MKSWARLTMWSSTKATGAIVYIVVDTGGWLKSKRFIVPPDAGASVACSMRMIFWWT